MSQTTNDTALGGAFGGEDEGLVQTNPEVEASQNPTTTKTTTDESALGGSFGSEESPLVQSLSSEAQDSADAAQASEEAALQSATNAANSANSASTSAANAAASESNASTSATSAANSAASAATSETNAATSATSAATSATQAALSETNALVSENSAALSEANANQSAIDAESSATSATSSALSAQSSATSASSSASSANTSATNAATSEVNAAVSANQAALSESNAATSETNAANSASTANAAATTATTKATEASTSATNAATSETNAATSATSASTSEANAAASAASATTSETNASASATSAATSETNAATSETNAALSETNAATSETNASASATAAATSETNASASATAAATSETNAATSATNAATSATAASTSEVNAAISEANAATSETNAATSATGAATSATNAATSASEAATSEANALIYKNAAQLSNQEAETAKIAAETAETNAATSATNAATSETNAATSATNAATSETNAADSATAASASETNAASSASDADTSASNAATSATQASTSETNAATSATSAATSATNAATSEANAATSEANAATSATNAATSATSASTSAGTATTKASEAATSAVNASASATSASSSATSASASASDALVSANQAATTLDNFEDIYLGAKASDPTLDNDGDALQVGALYFNTTDGDLRIWEGSVWTNVVVSADIQNQIDTSIASLVDSAPSALNTLNELAAALGDDPNFATTINNSIASLQNQITTVDTNKYEYNDDAVFNSVGFTNANSGEGVLTWNNTNHTMNLTMGNGVVQQVGEELYYPNKTRNMTGSAIPNGTPVMLVGGIGEDSYIAPAIADNSIPHEYYAGLTTEDIPDGSYGRVLFFGSVNDVDTSAYNKGDLLYVSPTVPGEFTTNKPESPNHAILAALVTKVGTTDGRMFVRVHTNPEANEITYDNTLSGLVSSNVKGALDELQQNKASVDLLSSNIVLFPTDSASTEVTGYNKLVINKEDPDYDTVAVNIPTGSIGTTETLVGALASDDGLVEGSIAGITVTLIGNIQKLTGNNNQGASFYFKIYRREANGTEHEMGESNHTNIIYETTGYEQFSASVYLNDGGLSSFSLTDRFVLKFYAIANATGTSYQFQFGGTSPVRAIVPVPISVVPSRSAAETPVDTSNFNGKLGSADTNVQVALDTLDDHDHDLEYASLTGYNKSNWDTAYSWGDHAGLYLPIDAVTLPDQTGHAGQFLTTDGSTADWATVDTSQGDTAYGWGNHADAGYLTSHQDISGKADLSGDTFTGALKLDSELQFLRGGSEYSNYIRAQNYPSQGYASSTQKYWLEYGTKGGHHFVVNTDGGSGSPENAYDDFTIWQGEVDGDRLFSVSNVGNVDISGTITASGYNKSNWDTAYGWGDHSTQGYLTTSTGVQQLSISTSPDYQTPSSRRVDPNASNPTNEHYAVMTYGNGGNVTGQLATHFQSGATYNRAYNNSWSAWSRMYDDDYHPEADYATSAGNADTVDSLHASSFIRSDANDTFTGNLTTGADNHITFGPNSTWGSSLRVGGNGRTATGTEMASVVTTDGNLHLDAADSTNGIYLGYYAGSHGTIFGSGSGSIVARMDTAGNLYKATSSTNITATYWHSANDGSGSGLDADLLDGQHASAFAPASHSHNYISEGGTSFSGEYPVAVRVSANNFYSDNNIRFEGATSKLTVDGSIVTGTGSFSGKVDFQGDAAIEGGSGYGIFKGYTTNNNHMIVVRGAVTGSGSSPTIVGDHQTTFVEFMNPRDETSGWFFKDSYTSGAYTYSEIARITTTGVHHGSSMRAPIFYDNNDTGYYTDANSMSRMRHLSLGDVYDDNDANWNARLNVRGSSHARIDVASNSDGIIGSFYAHTGHGGARLGTVSSHPTYLMYAGSTYGQWNNDYLKHDSDIRTPTFYDSDNTGYYANLSSTATSVNIAGNYQVPNQKGVYTSGAWVRVTTGYGYIDFGPANTGHAHIYTDRSNFYFNKMLQVNGGSQINTSDIRASIFYDRNNTSYYIHGDSTSLLYRLELNNKLDFRAQTGTWIESDVMTDAIGWNTSYGVYIGSNVGGTHYLRGNGTFTTGGNTYDLIHTGNIGSQSVAYAQNANNLDGLNSTAYMRDDGWNTSPGQDANTQSQMKSDFSYANNAPYVGELVRFGAGGYSLQFSSAYQYSGKLAFRTYNNDSAQSWNAWAYPAIYNHNSNGGGDLYANAYYDSNNTGYYANPASTSIFNDFRCDIMYDKDNTAYYVRPGSTSIFNDARANIWYSRSNTGYYSDPEATSNMLFIQMPHRGNGTSNIVVNNGGSENWRAIDIDGGNNNHGIGTSGTSRSVFGRNALCFHTSASDSIRFHSDGWDTTFEVTGGTGEGWMKGHLKTYGYQGHGNVGGTGSASWHPSGIYSAGTNWLYGTSYMDTVQGRIYYDRDDTAYFVNPAGTSELRNLYLEAQDSGVSEFRFGENSSGGYGSRWYWDSSYTHYWYSRHAGTDSTIMSQDTRYTHKIRLYRGLERMGHSTGYFIGSYNSVGANSTHTGPIYTIGDSYRPSDTALGNMYGIGFSHSNASFISGSGFSGWGMYVASAGTARVYLSGESGHVAGTGNTYFETYYDRNNTAYYANPASDSEFNNLGLNNLDVSNIVSTADFYASGDSAVSGLTGAIGGIEIRSSCKVIQTTANFLSNDNYGFTYAQFRNSGDTVNYGTIYRTGGSLVYSTSSDYRLKENIVPIDNPCDKLKKISVYNFNFIEFPDRAVDGFLAHELQEIIPEAVTGHKDEVDENGNPVYQGVDQSKLTPLLTAALQEALDKIESLEARLKVLENS